MRHAPAPRGVVRSSRGGASGPLLRLGLGLGLGLAGVVGVAACAVTRSEVPGAPPTAARAELARLYDADQADRARTWDTTMASIQSQLTRDAERRARVAALMRAGAARTADDYFHAAMVMQHGGDSTAYRLAHAWATRATQLDATHTRARWLTAAAWDRYLLEVGQPQWYGTQMSCDMRTRRVALLPIDTTRVTDAERERLGVLPLAARRERLARETCD